MPTLNQNKLKIVQQCLLYNVLQGHEHQVTAQNLLEIKNKCLPILVLTELHNYSFTTMPQHHVDGQCLSAYPKEKRQAVCQPGYYSPQRKVAHGQHT